MNYPSSFSLRIIQLDANEEDIPLGFVPGTFDEQDPKFADNRSKHKNDPVTMKKLRDKAASKSKKSSSKASKKKFDDFGRPRLPKHLYKNIQPTTEEVSRLNLSFSKDFEIFDPITSASTSVARTLKRTTDEFQQRVDTIVEEFVKRKRMQQTKEKLVCSNFNIIIMDKLVCLLRVTSTNLFLDLPHSQKGLLNQSAEKMAELVTLISKISVEVVKALKNEENKQSQDVNAADKEAGREDDLKNEDCSDLKTLEDEVSGTITDSIQAAVDTILFGLSTPSTTKSLDVGASNKMTESQWDLPDRQIPPDFPDAQVRKLETLKAKTPVKKERKKSRVLRSPYISKYGCVSKDVGDSDKEEKLKYAFDGDCGIFVCAYAEILSEELQVHSCRFDVASQRARNASLLWYYGVEKANEGYMSDNGDPPRPRKSRH
ncbi:hypothetical protein CQW23_19472 [Capsicum baccatum]|uniref:Ubiquitin-like protease family profile domain-containing protein n=1 Tax=Capsicum baccatum TaxID=33114 RepID=A0A2G2W5X4_CAPBA|nr:hypothetical protein CQW23_19472 [Capsicum baccatum]